MLVNKYMANRIIYTPEGTLQFNEEGFASGSAKIEAIVSKLNDVSIVPEKRTVKKTTSTRKTPVKSTETKSTTKKSESTSKTQKTETKVTK